MSKRHLGLFLVVLLAFSVCKSQKEERVSPLQLGPAVGSNGMVSTAHPLATRSGLAVLRAGGNAFDAAVTIAAMLNVVEPMNSGIGGYGTILIYDAVRNRTRFLDSSGKIPINVDSDMFRPPTPNYRENRRGAKAVSTPGNVNAWWAMSSGYGRLEWKELFDAAIQAAEDGIKIDERLARVIELTFPEFNPYAQSVYGKNGKPLKEGDDLIQKDLGQSFRLIASEGAKVVYNGELGRSIDEVMKENEGFMTIEDLKADMAEWWDPISIDYRGYEVMTASPPSTAFPSLIRLGLMSCFNNPVLGHNTTAYLHRFAEVTKHAYWCRLAFAGDPEINPPPLFRLLDEEYCKEIVDELDMDHARPFRPPNIVVKSGDNTTHFVVADKWGNIVSATQTLGSSFGCRIMVDGTGIWLNNSLFYCTFEPKGNPMDAHPGQRKLSGDCPTIVFKEGKPWIAIGTPGGHAIGQTVPQMIMNMIDFRMGIQQAIAAPRIAFVEPDFILVEGGIDSLVLDALVEMGHNIRRATGISNAHGLVIEYDDAGKPVRFVGGADPRGKGQALGY